LSPRNQYLSSSIPIVPSHLAIILLFNNNRVHVKRVQMIVFSPIPSPPGSSIDFGVLRRPWVWRFPESKQRFYTGCWLSHIWQISKVPAQAVNIKTSRWNP
jgi:hypothetical protein